MSKQSHLIARARLTPVGLSTYAAKVETAEMVKAEITTEVMVLVEVEAPADNALFTK